jgi:hypothetical protein
MVAMFCADQVFRQCSKKRPHDYELRYLLFPENVDFGNYSDENEIISRKAGSEPPQQRLNCRTSRAYMKKRSDVCINRARSSGRILRVLVSPMIIFVWG